MSGRTWRRLFEGREYSNSDLCSVLSWQPRNSFEDLVSAMVAEEGA